MRFSSTGDVEREERDAIKRSLMGIMNTFSAITKNIFAINQECCCNG